VDKASATKLSHAGFALVHNFCMFIALTNISLCIEGVFDSALKDYLELTWFLTKRPVMFRTTTHCCCWML